MARMAKAPPQSTLGFDTPLPDFTVCRFTAAIRHGPRGTSICRKDNRLLPHGFNKQKASRDIAVHGAASDDADFTAGGDRIRYSIATGGSQSPFRFEAELWFQPVAYRWAANLRPYDAAETHRFTRYYDAMALGSGDPGESFGQ